MANTDYTASGAMTPGGNVPTLTCSRYLANQSSQVLSFAGAFSWTRTKLKQGVLSFTKGLTGSKNSAPGLRWLINNLVIPSGVVYPSKLGEGGALRKGWFSFSGGNTILTIVKYLTNQASQVLDFTGAVYPNRLSGEEGYERKGLLGFAKHLYGYLSTLTRDGVLDLAGVVTYHGIDTEQVTKTGALNFVGGLYSILIAEFHEVYKNVELTFSGRITNKAITKLRTGTLSFEKYLTWQWYPYYGVERFRTVTSAISFVGSVAGYYGGVARSGAMTLAGVLYKGFEKTVGSVFLSCVGTVTGFLSPSGTLSSSMGFGGSLAYIQSGVRQFGTLGLGGELKRTFSITRKQTGTLSQPGELERTKELLYYGIINP